VLPAAGLLDRLKASHALRERTFTAVGYEHLEGWSLTIIERMI
jgi:hypothetical protein